MTSRINTSLRSLRVAVLLSVPGVAAAQTPCTYGPNDAPGTADCNFGGTGFTTTPLPQAAWATDVIVQPDGKIVTSAWGRDAIRGSRDFYVLRYNSDGMPDSSFDTDGIAAESELG